HHLQELAGIGRQALDIAPLPLGIDGVEGERRLARAGQAGHDDQLVARQVEIDVLEVVLARAANGDEFLVRHGPVCRLTSERPASWPARPRIWCCWCRPSRPAASGKTASGFSRVF